MMTLPVLRWAVWYPAAIMYRHHPHDAPGCGPGPRLHLGLVLGPGADETGILPGRGSGARRKYY